MERKIVLNPEIFDGFCHSNVQVDGNKTSFCGLLIEIEQEKAFVCFHGFFPSFNSFTEKVEKAKIKMRVMAYHGVTTFLLKILNYEDANQGDYSSKEIFGYVIDYISENLLQVYKKPWYKKEWELDLSKQIKPLSFSIDDREALVTFGF